MVLPTAFATKNLVPLALKTVLNTNYSKFSFNFVSFQQILDEINKYNAKKAPQITDISVPIIKGNKDVFVLFIYINFNNSLSSSSFPAGLKYANVRLIFK